MDFNSTIDIIIKDLEEAREIIDDLKKYQGVPVLQVELAKSKCRSAGEIIALLKRQDTEASPVIKPVSADTIDIEITSAAIDFRTPVVTPAVTPTITHASTPVAAPVAKDINIPPVMVTVPPVIIPTTEVEIKKGLKKIPKKNTEDPIIADKFNSLTSIHELMVSNNTEDDLGELLKTKPLNTLAEGIGLNDKFLFMSEIFNGNKDEYAKAISQLDKVESLSDARAVIMSYIGDNNEGEAVKQLLNLVKRKIPSNE